jgi:hypothetical protein
MIRRRLQGIGALQLNNDRWLLPHTSEHEQFLSRISTDLIRQHGSGHFSLWQADNDRQEHDFIHKFQVERQQEYTEFLKQEQLFLQALAHDIKAKQWTFAKLEAHEHSLHKLSIKQRSIRQRDFFPASNSLATTDLLEQCDQAVYEFALMVYTHCSSQQ